MDKEQEQDYFKRTILSDEVRFQQFYESIEELASSSAIDFGVEAAMYQAIIAKYDSDSTLVDTLQDFVVARTDLSTTQHRYMLRSGIQKLARRETGSNSTVYPENHHDAGNWISTLTMILGSTALHDELRYDLHNRRPQTNIPDRYKSIPTFVGWARANGRLPEKLTLFDFGCARNLGIKSLAAVELNSEPAFAVRKFYTYGDTLVVDPVDTSDITVAETVITNDQLTVGFNIAQNTPIGLDIGVGFDIDDFNVPGTREWSVANVTPNEFANGTAYTIELFEAAFTDKKHTVGPNIKFVAEDVLLRPEAYELNRLEVVNGLNEAGCADVSIIFTTLNQMSNSQQIKALDSIRRYTKPDGFIVIQDFARVHPDSPLDLEFLDSDWNQHYSYRTIVMDMTDLTRFIELFRFNSGRAQTVNIPQDRVGHAPQISPAEGYKGVDITTYLGNLATRY